MKTIVIILMLFACTGVGAEEVDMFSNVTEEDTTEYPFTEEYLGQNLVIVEDIGDSFMIIDPNRMFIIGVCPACGSEERETFEDNGEQRADFIRIDGHDFGICGECGNVYVYNAKEVKKQ